jgi:hypothetical protein
VTASDRLGIAGLAIGILGIVLAVISIAYDRRQARLVYQMTGSRVVRAAPTHGITVQYNGEDIPQVTRTQIIFWNAGQKTFEETSIVEEYPVQFRFEGEDTRVLSVELIGTSDLANKFSVRKNGHGQAGVIFSFKYLDPDQGAVVEVLHTSESWKAIPSGKIKGAPRGVVERKAPWEGSKLTADLVHLVPAGLVAIGLGVGFVILTSAPLALVYRIVLSAVLELVVLYLLVLFPRRFMPPKGLSSLR